MIGVCILGSTGTIGDNTLDVIAQHPDRYRVVALGARANWRKLAAQCRRFAPDHAVLMDGDAARELERELRASSCHTRVASGASALDAIAAAADSPYVMAGIVGAAGLRPVLAAARAGKRLMLANKEALVMSGSLLLETARNSRATLLPIDSEHNAIFQCLPQHAPGAEARSAPRGVRRVLLTASGGPFRDWSLERLATATPEQAVAHPNWVMGRKISVDSATLMNKGLECIEAGLLFALDPAQIDVVVHRQSIVHSMVEYLDGSVLAQLSSPDMRTPIAHALAWPERMASGVQFLDLVQVGRLDFTTPDVQRFPCLALARQVAVAGGLAPAMLNAANEVAVEAFLDGKVNFLDIAAVSETVMQQSVCGPISDLDSVLAADAEARRLAHRAVAARRLASGTVAAHCP